ncbi:MAG: DNA polymerase III subunit chi [Alphaproteobacteria bacterium]|nr:DNA polymerase III subunit chi [Alphaproteobacteria bacterium]
MTEVRFYHMERSTLESALPALLNKAVMQGNVIVQSSTPQNVEALNTHLWAYNPDSFLPHGSEKDGNPEQQPIWLTDRQENPNNANILTLTHGATNENIKDYKLCCEMLDGNDQNAVAAARQKWTSYKDQGFDITYWQQGQNGWEKKAG